MTSMFTGCRLCRLPLLVALTGCSALAGCHKTAAKEAADQAADGDSVKRSLGGLASQLGELEARFSTLRRQVEALPPDLPGFRDVRARFYAAEESRGITDAKVRLLAKRVQSAVGAGKSQELRRVSTDIAETYDEVGQLDRLHVAFLHQVLAFQRMASPTHP